MLLLLAPAGPGACSPAHVDGVAAPFELALVRPANAEGLFLNEDLVFYFTDEVDRASVTRESVRIRTRARAGAAGSGTAERDARGTLQVDGRRIRFVPAPVLAPDLRDGGYLPGTEYQVTLAGFPHPDGLRSVRGAVLAQSVTWSFRTVQVTEPRSGLVFDDRMQDRVGVLRAFPTPVSGIASTYVFGPEDAIYLASDKPIDPSSVEDAHFEIRVPDRDASLGYRKVEVRARVIENEPTSAPRARPPGVRASGPAERWERERRATLIELVPRGRVAIPTARKPGDVDCSLWVRPASLRDFGGQPVFSPAHGALQLKALTQAIDPSRDALHEEFLDARLLRSPVAVPGFDGTAHWSDTGRVEVRYPAAAGSGADGAVVLEGEEHRADVEATRLDVAEGRTCTLQATPGLVVLRAQGRLSVRGRLVRSAPWDARKEAEGDDTLAEWQRLVSKDRTSPQTLSQWIAIAREKNTSWTVLIAGGDLVVEGEIETSTPLLLCAGGVIRVSGAVKGVHDTIRLLGDGGGRIQPRESRAPIQMDEPQGENPLAVPLRLAVLSGPIPSQGEVVRWLSADARGSGPELGGSWRVRYVPEVRATTPRSEDLAPVESPLLLEQPGSIQLLIELEVAPGGTWNAETRRLEPGAVWAPPWVDSVRLTWESPQPQPRRPEEVRR